MNAKPMTAEEVRGRAKQNNDQDTLRQLDQIEEARKALERSKARRTRKAGETRGGAREGAGRPKKEGERATEQISFRLTPSERAALVNYYGDDEDTIHKVCARLVRQAMPPDTPSSSIK